MTTKTDTDARSPLIESRAQLIETFARGEKPPERWRIGTEEGLRRLTRDDVAGFYRTFYRPSATVLAVVGDLDLNYESMELPSEPGLVMNVYTAPAGSPTADALAMLASWAASQDQLAGDAAVASR